MSAITIQCLKEESVWPQRLIIEYGDVTSRLLPNLLKLTQFKWDKHNSNETRAKTSSLGKAKDVLQTLSVRRDPRQKFSCHFHNICFARFNLLCHVSSAFGEITSLHLCFKWVSRDLAFCMSTSCLENPPLTVILWITLKKWKGMLTFQMPSVLLSQL